MVSRRQFLGICAAGIAFPARLRADPPDAGRSLDFTIADDFGDVGKADISAVLQSAGESIWKNCPNTRWQVPGFYIYRSRLTPITLNDHRSDGRIAIGLATSGNHWAQFAFQFAHEFCHALAGHSNDWHKPSIAGKRANLWFEESVCEAASIFALRAIGKTWKTDPPYPNWKDYADDLTKYADDRVAEDAKDLSDDSKFEEWFRDNEPKMRADATLRPKNGVVALKLLPLFEKSPSGWESMTFWNLGKVDPEIKFAAKLADWRSVVPEAQRKFVSEIGSVFSLAV